jgi:uncharacterized protein YbjT (DUF2867 family)
MIVVTTPTGNIGAQVLDGLLAAGAPVRVIARDSSKLPTHVRDRVEIVEGSHSDTAVLDIALAGAERLFWLVPPNPSANSVEDVYVGFTRPVIDALQRHRISHVVNITALGRGSPLADNAGLVTSSLRMDDLFIDSGVAFRGIACPSFMNNITRQAIPIREKGLFFNPFDGDHKMPVAATQDIAAIATRFLLDTRWSGAAHEAVLGPEDLSFNDMALIMSEVLARPIRYQQISFDAYKAGFVARGMSAAMAQAMTDMARAKNEGLDNAEPRTAANTTSTTFREWCETALASWVRC